MPSPSSSVYAFKPSGSLKFKGGEGLPSADKKKKKKTKSSSSQDVRHAAGRTPEGAVMHKHDKHREGAEGDEERSPVEAMDRGRPMTAAERKFEEVRRKRVSTTGEPTIFPVYVQTV